MLSNCADALGLLMRETQQVAVFADSGDIAGYAADAVARMVRAGVIGGRTDGRFDPRAKAERAEVAAMLRRFVEAVE